VEAPFLPCVWAASNGSLPASHEAGGPQSRYVLSRRQEPKKVCASQKAQVQAGRLAGRQVLSNPPPMGWQRCGNPGSPGGSPNPATGMRHPGRQAVAEGGVRRQRVVEEAHGAGYTVVPV